MTFMKTGSDNNSDQDEPAALERPPSRLGSGQLLAMTAIVLSLGALAVSVFEVSTIRDEQRIQAWPYVALSQSYGPEGFRLRASNKGIGPARVRTVTLRYQGTAYDELDELILNTVGEENAFSYDVYKTSDIARSILSPEESATLFSVPWEPRTRLLLDRWAGNIDIELCYCSVYDECWLSRLEAPEPAPVEACPTT